MSPRRRVGSLVLRSSVASILAVMCIASSGCASAQMELDLQRARIDAEQSRIERDRAMLAASAALVAAEQARTAAETRAATCESRLAQSSAPPSAPPEPGMTVIEGRFSLSDVPSDWTLALPTPITVSVEGGGFREDFAADSFGRIALELPAGRHVITIAAVGYVPQRFGVELPTPSGSLLLAATLLQRPGKRPPAKANRGGAGTSRRKAGTDVVDDPFNRSQGSSAPDRSGRIDDPFDRGSGR